MSPSTSTHARQPRRGFTLIELIVTLLVLGILATIAVVAYSTVTGRAQSTAAQANLRQVATAITAQALRQNADVLDRADVLAAMRDTSLTVVDGLSGSGATLTLLSDSDVPADPTQIAVAFDNGAGTPAGNDPGTRIALLSAGGDSSYSTIVDIQAGTQTPTSEQAAGMTARSVLEHSSTAPGTPVPGAVGAVTVTGVTTSTATLTWAPVPGATGYLVSDLTAGTSSNVSGTTAHVTGTGGVATQYTVAAVNATGTGPASPAVTVAYLTPHNAEITYDLSAPGCPDTTIIVPAAGTVTGTISWGDGESAALTARPTHTFPDAGVYTVAIDGTFTTFGSGVPTTGLNDAPCITSVTQWRATGTTSLAFAFMHALNLTAIPTDMDTSLVTSTTSMFQQAAAFNRPVTFDTSKVTNMSGMFQEATAFNQPLTFDTSRVTTMAYMFKSATSFNQPLTLNTANVTLMTSMFSGATVFNQPLAFDTTKVTKMDAMFANAAAFNRPLTFDTSKVTSMSSMFYGAAVFNQPLPFDTTNVSGMAHMFEGAASFNQPLAFTTSNVVDMGYMFVNASAFNQDLSAWSTAKVVSHLSFDTGATSWVLARPTFTS